MRRRLRIAQRQSRRRPCRQRRVIAHITAVTKRPKNQARQQVRRLAVKQVQQQAQPLVQMQAQQQVVRQLRLPLRPQRQLLLLRKVSTV